ncbi:MAG: hypothetical protein ABIS50_19040 [Luteolibacter sp.]|uniref:hypothetical protein n=1 Tax=Luteolibacter sp. TaxID=1962973 RepID=UPI003263B491
MKPLARSLTFHLVAPYLAHLALIFLLIRSIPDDVMVWIFLFGGFFVLLGAALVAIPFGAAHLIQALYFAPGWPSARQQFLMGLLNPSFAAITLAFVFLMAPRLLF